MRYEKGGFDTFEEPKCKKVKGSGVVVQTSHVAYKACMALYEDEYIGLRESFHVLYLNRRNDIMFTHCVGIGGRSSVVVDPVFVLRPALIHAVSSIILTHNHPSGNLKPSDQDIAITKKIKECAKLFDIAVMDHIIVMPEEGKYYSFADEGFLQ